MNYLKLTLGPATEWRVTTLEPKTGVNWTLVDVIREQRNYNALWLHRQSGLRLLPSDIRSKSSLDEFW